MHFTIIMCTCSIILAALSTGSSGVLYSCVLSSSLCCRDFTRPLHSPWGSSDEAWRENVYIMSVMWCHIMCQWRVEEEEAQRLAYLVWTNYSSREDYIGGTVGLEKFASRYLQQLDYDSLSCDVLPDSHVMSHDATQCHVMSRDATQCHVMSHDATQCHVMSHDATQCHMMPHNVMWWHTMSCDVIWWHTMSCDVTWCTQCHVMSHDATQCHVMSCDATQCHVTTHNVMWWHTMSCDVMWRRVIQSHSL